MSDVAYLRVQTHLVRLNLPRMAECLDALAQEVSFDDRQTVLDLKKHVNDLQDKIVEQIMHD